jgi:hypothetical protein
MTDPRDPDFRTRPDYRTGPGTGRSDGMPTWGWAALALAVFLAIAGLLMWGGSPTQQQAGTQTTPPASTMIPPARSPANPTVPPLTPTPAPSQNR